MNQQIDSHWQNNIKRIALQLLDTNPSPVAKLRILSEILLRPEDDSELIETTQLVYDSNWVKQLESEQHADGSWGSFHSQSTKAKQSIGSTEVGVERAINLGLSRHHSILRNASAYIRSAMADETRIPDYHEKNDRWPTGLRLFLASTLALIEPQAPELDNDRALWATIASETFKSGTYDELAEIASHRRHTGASVKDSYLVLNNRYQLIILGSKIGLLSPDVEQALLKWIWSRPDGVGYLDISLIGNAPTQPGRFDRWMASLELLLRRFPTATTLAEPHIQWIWEQQNSNGFWDFGPRPAATTHLPYSRNWRKRIYRIQDWTTRVLILLKHQMKT